MLLMFMDVIRAQLRRCLHKKDKISTFIRIHALPFQPRRRRRTSGAGPVSLWDDRNNCRHVHLAQKRACCLGAEPLSYLM
jgi:hypothetical protein